MNLVSCKINDGIVLKSAKFWLLTTVFEIFQSKTFSVKKVWVSRFFSLKVQFSLLLLFISVTIKNHFVKIGPNCVAYAISKYRISANSFRPWIVSAPVCTQYCDQRSQYIRLNSKKNSFHGNYSRKYGTLEIKTFSLGSRTQDVCS